MAADDPEAMQNGRFQGSVLLTELFRDTGTPSRQNFVSSLGIAKLPSVLNYLKENFLELEEIPKFVVFAHHKDIITGIDLELTKMKVISRFWLF